MIKFHAANLQMIVGFYLEPLKHIWEGKKLMYPIIFVLHKHLGIDSVYYVQKLQGEIQLYLWFDTTVLTRDFKDPMTQSTLSILRMTICTPPSPFT